ncbi:uncharacterized protein LOC131636706 [Vicia villosa]|uniref:uncharacterized protein LOC131636706 n=1 Tax=Vicia villosa TaxID=3911 RepID=UPI00273C11EA|nr:uncharacterized protein LOC131636706 [Vicia villosa]
MIWKSLCDMLFRLANVLINSNHLDSDDIHEEVVEAKGLDFYFKFEKGKLEIEQLHVTKTTKSKWCNLIAWEHHKKSTSTSTTFPDGGRGGKFTWAALIFNGLICCADDVQLLKDKKIVVDHLKMSNQELMEFFRTIEIGVDDKVVECSDYIQMVDDMNNYHEASFIERMWKTLWNSIVYHRHDWL